MKEKKEESKSFLFSAGLMLIFVAIIALIIFLLNGQTTITGEYEGRKNTETVVCESDKVAYSIFAFDGSDSKQLKISAIFSNEVLSSISLMYKLNYSDDETLQFSEARNHSEMNQNFDQDNMKPDSLEAKYGIMSDGMQFTIYAKDEDISQKTLRYFMLYNIYEPKKLNKEKMVKVYNKAGLDCVTKYNKPKEEVNEK